MIAFARSAISVVGLLGPLSARRMPSSAWANFSISSRTVARCRSPSPAWSAFGSTVPSLSPSAPVLRLGPNVQTSDGHSYDATRRQGRVYSPLGV